MSEVIKVCDNYLSVKYVSHWHCLMLILPDKWPIILYGTCTKRGCIFRGKSMLCDSAAIIISLLTIAFKNIQYYCYSITFLKDLLIDIWLKNKHLMFIKFHLNNKVKVLVTNAGWNVISSVAKTYWNLESKPLKFMRSLKFIKVKFECKHYQN